MDLGLWGRSALVGGASSGIGEAIAHELAAEGCRLMLWARRPEALDGVAGRLSDQHGVQVATVVADARDPNAAARVTDASAQTLGTVDIVVLNAGGPPSVDSARTNSDDWRTYLQLLAITPIEIATRLLVPMRAQRWGRIVAVLSSGVRQPIPELAYSNGSRSALAAWLKTVAAAVARDGVTANGVLPGRIATERAKELERGQAERQHRSVEDVRREREAAIPAGRYGRPEEVAAAVAFFCSDRAGYVTGTFQAVDGGLLAGI